MIRKLIPFVLLVAALPARSQSTQTVNGNLYPSTTGYSLGAPSQRWNAKLLNLDVTGTFTVNGRNIQCSGTNCTIAGVAGATGATGAAGPAGAAGTAATITVGTVSTGAAGSSVIVNNRGTSSAAILDFTIPRGDAGQNGAGSGTVTTFSAGTLAPLFTTSVTDPTGAPALAFSLSTVATANKFFASPSGAGGAPSFRAIVGADLPNPSASTLGGVQSKAAEANKFVTQIGTDGTITLAQPSSSNLSDATAIQLRHFVFRIGSDQSSTALLDTDDESDIAPNGFGRTITITKVRCKSNAGSPTIMLTDGTNNILAGNLTCTNGAWASTTSFNGTYNQIADGGKINYQTVTAGGTAKRITVEVLYQ